MTLAGSDRCNISDEEVFVFPASFGQQRLWFLDRLFPNSSCYNVVNVLRLTGLLNVTVLESSFNEIIRRHEVLRTNFDTVDGKPVQLILPELKISIPLIDWQVSCTLAPDPVWALESIAVPGLWSLPAPRVAVTLRSHPLLTPARLATFTRALVDFQTATQTCILLVPFQQTQDLAIAQAIQPQLPGKSEIFSLEDPKALKGLFRGVEMAIGMRLHSLIMAASEGCRCFALSYDPKVSQLMSDLDMPGWELAQMPEDPNVISKMWIEHFVNGDATSLEQIESLIDRAKLHQELLKAAII